MNLACKSCPLVLTIPHRRAKHERALSTPAHSEALMPTIIPEPSATVPLADTAPKAESKIADPGAMSVASRADHTHPRLTSSTTATLDGNGQATVMFTRTFSVEPSVTINAVENDTRSPPDFKVMRFLDQNGTLWVSGMPYGGCVVYGTRARALPALNALTDLLAGVVGKLSGYVPTEPAAGVKFSIIAVQNSVT